MLWEVCGGILLGDCGQQEHPALHTLAGAAARVATSMNGQAAAEVQEKRNLSMQTQARNCRPVKTAPPERLLLANRRI
jgi:hypothetical protein